MNHVYIGLENQMLGAIIKDVCANHKLEVSHFADIKNAKRDDFIFVDEKYLEKLNKDFTHIILLTDRPFEESFLNSIKRSPIPLIQGMDSHNFQWEVDKLVSQLLSEQLLHLEDYLQIDGSSEIWEKKMVDFKEVYDYIQDGASILRLDEWRKMEDKFRTVAHEIIMNAFFDSQKDEDGKQVHFDEAREKDIKFSPEEAPILKVAQDGSFIGFSVRDNYGTLKFSEIREALGKCLEKDDVLTLRQSGEGAGIGLYMCCTTSSKIVFNVKPGEYTEVICLMFKTKRNVDSETVVPSFSYFSRDDKIAA